MPDLDIEDVVSKLLVFMVEKMEIDGDTVNTASFDFESEGGDYSAFIERYPELEPVLYKALNVCLSRRLLEHSTLGSRYNCLDMTARGHALGCSVKHQKPGQPAQPTFHIGAITSHAPMQIGNGNTMTIDDFHAAALAGIEAADAPQEQKAEAKSLLAKVLEHPLLCSVLGGIAGGLTSGLTGRG